MSDAIGGIVLAGGRSSRFGRDKMLEVVDGVPMLDRAMLAVQAIASDVVVVAAPEVDRPVPLAVRIVHDAAPFEGPLAGIAAGLSALDEGVDRAIVVGGDMPSLVPAVLADLVACLADPVAPGDVALLEVDGPRALLPMAIRRSVAPRLDALLVSGERRLGALVESGSIAWLPSRIWRAADPTGATLLDIDVPADLGS